MYLLGIHFESVMILPPMSKTTKPKVITFRVSSRVYSELSSVAKGTGVSVSDILRICVQGELPKLKEKYVGNGTGD